MSKEQLIKDNMNLVYHLINRYYPTFKNDEDIVQTGMLGLCKAADTWDSEKSVFSTYAGTCILNEIKLEFRNRKKHSGVLSLDYETTDSEGKQVPFGDLVVGSEDVDYVDTSNFDNTLTSFEQRVVELRKQGMSALEIANQLNCGKQRIQKTLRKLKCMWRIADGDFD